MSHGLPPKSTRTESIGQGSLLPIRRWKGGGGGGNWRRKSKRFCGDQKFSSQAGPAGKVARVPKIKIKIILGQGRQSSELQLVPNPNQAPRATFSWPNNANHVVTMPRAYANRLASRFLLGTGA